MYDKLGTIEYDPRKNELNIRTRGISFESVRRFEFSNAMVWVDERHDYGEVRYVAIGPIGSRIHVLCFTEQATGIRVLSLRKANPREVSRYDQIQALD